MSRKVCPSLWQRHASPVVPTTTVVGNVVATSTHGASWSSRADEKSQYLAPGYPMTLYDVCLKRTAKPLFVGSVTSGVFLSSRPTISGNAMVTKRPTNGSLSILTSAKGADAYLVDRADDVLFSATRY